MNHIEFPGYILASQPLGADGKVADLISERADLLHTLHISNHMQPVFDLMLTKTEVLTVLIGNYAVWGHVKWRSFP